MIKYVIVSEWLFWIIVPFKYNLDSFAIFIQADTGDKC